MALAITAVASITLVAVGVIRIKLVVTIAPFLGAFAVFTNVFVLEMGTITAYRWIPVSGISLRPWGGERRLVGASVAPPQLPPWAGHGVEPQLPPWAGCGVETLYAAAWVFQCSGAH